MGVAGKLIPDDSGILLGEKHTNKCSQEKITVINDFCWKTENPERVLNIQRLMDEIYQPVKIIVAEKASQRRNCVYVTDIGVLNLRICKDPFTSNFNPICFCRCHSVLPRKKVLLWIIISDSITGATSGDPFMT